MNKKDAPAETAPDPWKQKLQATLKQERPSPRRWGFWLGLVFLAAMALVVWLLLPRTPTGLPAIVTFDVLTRPEDEVVVRAIFDVKEGDAPVAGRTVIFQESRLPLPGQELLQAKTEVTSASLARATLKPGLLLTQIAFEANCPGGERQSGVKDQGVIYVRPAATPLLVVSVEGTLSIAGVEEWKKSNAQNPAAVPEAPPALQEAQRLGYQIVYLALEPDAPPDYQKRRVWTRYRFGVVPTALPEGPILGRPEYPGDLAAATSALLGELKEKFTDRRVAVTADPAAAERFQAAGWRTLLIGDGAALPGVERVRGWSELGKALGK